MQNFLKVTLVPAVVLLLGSSAFAQQLPKGTVISWVPPKEAIDIRDPLNPKIALPTGWKSCESGQEGFKQDRFIYGTTLAGYISRIKNKDALFAGSPTHTHSASMGDNNKIVGEIDPGSGKSAADAYHTHPITVNEGSSIPPYAVAILLCNS